MKIIALLWLIISFEALAALYVGGVVVDDETRLIISDDETGACISVSTGGDFKWITEPGQLTPVLEFVEKYNVHPNLTEFCNSSVGWHVAVNRIYSTRPMKDENFNKTPERILVNHPCENTMVKPYSSNDDSRGWFFATNAKGYRGLVICDRGGF